MQVQHRNTLYNPQFKALHIANAGDLKLYKLTNFADKRYLQNLTRKIQIEELMPNLSKEESNRWQEMLQYAVDNAQDIENITYLETHNNKPCGIITFRLEPGASILDCICTFPTETGKKVKLAGKTLFYQMFKDFLQNKSKKIELQAITNGPFNVVKKYESLGFKQTSNITKTTVSMETTKFKVLEVFKKLRELIDYNPQKLERVNLTKELD